MPREVVEIHGNKCTVKDESGQLHTDVHMEDVLVVPAGCRNLESPDPIMFEDPEAEPPGARRRSPGAMIEDEGREVEAHEAALKKFSKGKLERLQTGQFVVYSAGSRSEKICRVGKIVSLSSVEKMGIVQRYGARTSQRLKTTWSALYETAEGVSYEPGPKPAEERVEYSRMLSPVQLVGDAIDHATSRKLFNGGWTVEKIEDSPEAVVAVLERYESESKVASAAVQLSNQRAKSQPRRGDRVLRSRSGRPICERKGMDFVEVFRGYGEATHRVQEAGLRTADGIRLGV